MSTTRHEALSRPEDVSASLAAEALLELGLKPVVRELHDEAGAQQAVSRWRARGYDPVVGEPIREDVTHRAMVTERDTVHTIRPLATHPVVARAVQRFGRPAARLLLDERSPVYRWLAERTGADRAPDAAHVAAGPDEGGPVRVRRVVYVSRDRASAREAATLDRMGADDRGPDDPRRLGELLGYPSCCVEAFASLERRWPNRRPLEASWDRTASAAGVALRPGKAVDARALRGRFLPRLDNVALDRFAYIAWFPCRFDCAASARLADAAAEFLASTHGPLVAELDRRLGSPRVYWRDGVQAVLRGATTTSTGTLRFDTLEPLEAFWPRARMAGVPDADTPWRPLEGSHEVAVGPRGVAWFFRDGKRLRPPDGVEPPALFPFGL